MKELDLTKGSVPKVLMQFAMPYLLANVLQALYGKHSKKCTFYTLRFGCSFAAVNTIKPQLL